MSEPSASRAHLNGKGGEGFCASFRAKPARGTIATGLRQCSGGRARGSVPWHACQP